TVMPAPALTVAPLTKPLPSIVTGTVAPLVPCVGDTALTTTDAVVVVVACADVPSENVAVTVRVRPAAKPWPLLLSEANSRRLPPSGTVVLTAIVDALFSSAPSTDVATPSTQAAFGEIVSHVPPMPFESCRAVIVRPPAALNVRVI